MTGAPAQTTSADDPRMILASVPLRGLTAVLIALFALDNVLLLGFLGWPPLLVGALAAILPLALACLFWKSVPGECRIGVPTILVCFAVAAILLILGGEGRLFYATADWQIRDAVLADMGNHRWPFDYWLDGKAQLLRAPIGMYLVPALLGGPSQIGRDWALLAHNMLVLGLLLSIGSALFDSRRGKWIALIVFVMFSGLDVIGNLINDAATGAADWDHIERWAANYQYSSHITQIFWVPQHAFAGWTAALTYMLWRKGIVPIGLLAASLPLVALWSPLVLFGALPFAVFAGARVLLTRAWKWRDILVCGLAILLATPALLYLSAGAGSVGGGLLPMNLAAYVLLLLLEVWPFLRPLLRGQDGVTDHATILIAGICLLLMPLWAIGMSNDFQMRASIMPLALVAIAFARWAGRLENRSGKAWFLVVITLGSVTGTAEIARAFRLVPSPAPHCSLAGVWSRQSGFVVAHDSYFAARNAFPVRIDPRERVRSAQPLPCWNRPWNVPGSSAAAQQEH